jgi:hypothetical protein
MTSAYEPAFPHGDHHFALHALTYHSTLVLRSAEHLLHAGHQLTIKRPEASITIVELTKGSSLSPSGSDPCINYLGICAPRGMEYVVRQLGSPGWSSNHGWEIWNHNLL